MRSILYSPVIFLNLTVNCQSTDRLENFRQAALDVLLHYKKSSSIRFRNIRRTYSCFWDRYFRQKIFRPSFFLFKTKNSLPFLLVPEFAICYLRFSKPSYRFLNPSRLITDISAAEYLRIKPLARAKLLRAFPRAIWSRLKSQQQFSMIPFLSGASWEFLVGVFCRCWSHSNCAKAINLNFGRIWTVCLRRTIWYSGIGQTILTNF